MSTIQRIYRKDGGVSGGGGGGGIEITTDHVYQEREQCQQYKKYTEKTRVWVGGGGGRGER